MDSFIACASVRSAYDGYEYYTEGRVVSVEHKGGGVYSGAILERVGLRFDDLLSGTGRAFYVAFEKISI